MALPENKKSLASVWVNQPDKATHKKKKKNTLGIPFRTSVKPLLDLLEHWLQVRGQAAHLLRDLQHQLLILEQKTKQRGLCVFLSLALCKALRKVAHF